MIQHISRTVNSDFHIEAIGSQSITLMGPSEIPQTVTMTYAGCPSPLPTKAETKMVAHAQQIKINCA